MPPVDEDIFITGNECGDMHTSNDEESGENERNVSKGRGGGRIYTRSKRRSGAQELTTVRRDEDELYAREVRRGCERHIDRGWCNFRIRKNEIQTSPGNGRGRVIAVQKADILRTNSVSSSARRPFVRGGITNRLKSTRSCRMSQ